MFAQSQQHGMYEHILKEILEKFGAIEITGFELDAAAKMDFPKITLLHAWPGELFVNDFICPHNNASFLRELQRELVAHDFCSTLV